MPEKTWFISFAVKNTIGSSRLDYTVTKCRHPFEWALQNAVVLVNYKECEPDEVIAWDWASNGVALEDVVPVAG